MPIVNRPLSEVDSSLPVVAVNVSRHTIDRLRWRVRAEDGLDLAFELNAALQDGDAVWKEAGKLYRIQQSPESALQIDWPSSDRSDAARLAWNLGNLHQPIEVREDGIYVADDPAMRTKLSRMRCVFREIMTVFRPMTHHNHHAH